MDLSSTNPAPKPIDRKSDYNVIKSSDGSSTEQVDGREHNASFTILGNSETFVVSQYEYYPTCDFSAIYTIENGGLPIRIEDATGLVDETSDFTQFWTASSNPFVPLSDPASAATKAVSPAYTLTLKSDEPLDGGGYFFEVSVKIITDPNDPTSLPPVGVTGFTRYFNIFADNPCLSTEVLKSVDLEEPIRLYSILGIGGTIEIAEFTDSVSMAREVG